MKNPPNDLPNTEEDKSLDMKNLVTLDSDMGTDSSDFRIEPDELNDSPTSENPIIERLKLYLSDKKYRIKLGDQMDDVLKDVQHSLQNHDIFAEQNSFNRLGESSLSCIKHYATNCETLIAMAMVSGSWMEENCYSMWSRVIKELGSVRSKSGIYPHHLELQRFPATLIFYALGMGALKFDRIDYLKHLFGISIYDFRAESTGSHFHHLSAAEILPPYNSFTEVISQIKLHDDFKDKRLPMNHIIFDTLKSNCEVLNISEGQFSHIFNRFEVLIALNSLSNDGSTMIPGLFYVETDYDRATLLSEIHYSIHMCRDKSPYVTSGIFDSIGDGIQRLDKFHHEMKKNRRIY